MTEKLKEFSELIDQQRLKEAFVLFLEQARDKSWNQLLTSDLAMLDMLCRQVLPELREHHTLWMVNHPNYLRRMLVLLTEALTVKYQSAATIDHIAWFRCLLAIEEAMTGQLERVHQELCLVDESKGTGAIPKPNGECKRQVQSIQLREKSTSEFLAPFFESYLSFLKRIGRYEFSNQLENRINKLIGLIARDEKQPGVVQALFYDKIKRRGYLQFIHVSMEYKAITEEESTQETIVYAGSRKDSVDPALQEAAKFTRQIVDTYLKRTGYPDGLTSRVIHWEIATAKGDKAELGRQFQGGSLALPLAVGIVSRYLAEPVPTDIAFTGAFNITSVANGQILPVDGVPEKVEHAARSGSRVIYIPSANLTGSSLQSISPESSSKIVFGDTLDKICGDLFPPEGSGRLRDTIKDTWANFMQLLPLINRPRKHKLTKATHERYWTYIIICSILTAGLVFLEGWRIFKASVSAYPSFAAWFKILASTAIVFGGMCISFALPAACLRHRKFWSWYAGATVLAIVFAVATVLIGWMSLSLPLDGSIYKAPPVAGMVKDMFVIWIFAWAIAVNTFTAVAALESLIAKRQFVTAQICLDWNSPLEGRMPLRCVHFPWKWGLVCIGIVSAYLIVLDLNYYSSLDNSTVSAYWETFLGLGRDLVFIAAIAEVMIFYKASMATIRRALATSS